MISTVHDAALLGWLSSSKRNLEIPLNRTVRGGAVKPHWALADWSVAHPDMGVLGQPLFGGCVLVDSMAQWLNLPPYMGLATNFY